jgi:translation elongation factor EF-1alpha
MLNMRFNNLVSRPKGTSTTIPYLPEKSLIQPSTLVIPSDLQGQNFIERSPKTCWYTNPTLVTALDEIFS